MNQEKWNIMWFLSSFHDKDGFFEKLTAPDNALKQAFNLYVYVLILSFIYGAVMGSYHGLLQALATAIKIPFLLTITLVVCFPALFMVQTMLGSKLGLSQMTAIMMTGFAFMTSIMLSCIPIVAVFLLTGGNYYFLHLLHIAVFLFAGVFGMKMAVDALKFSCEKRNVYPQVGVVVFRFWVVIFAFVGIQLAWNLQPFMGDIGKPFKLFRKHEGNFYTAVIYAARQLTAHQPAPSAAAPQTISGFDSLFHPDTAAQGNRP